MKLGIWNENKIFKILKFSVRLEAKQYSYSISALHMFPTGRKIKSISAVHVSQQQVLYLS